jgi:hypothetical protein
LDCSAGGLAAGSGWRDVGLGACAWRGGRGALLSEGGRGSGFGCGAALGGVPFGSVDRGVVVVGFIGAASPKTSGSTRIRSCSCIMAKHAASLSRSSTRSCSGGQRSNPILGLNLGLHWWRGALTTHLCVVVAVRWRKFLVVQREVSAMAVMCLSLLQVAILQQGCQVCTR